MKLVYKYIIGIAAILFIAFPIDINPIIAIITSVLGATCIFILIEINHNKPNKD